MRTALVLVLLTAVTTIARADGFYYTETVGPVRVSDELGPYFHGEMATRIRTAGGMRRGDWALEVGYAGVINVANSDRGGGSENRQVDPNPGAYGKPDPDLVTFGLDLKHLFPVSQHLELYVRGSASLGFGTGTLDGWSGRGLGFGGGAQLKMRGSVWGLLFPPLFWAIRKGPMMTGAVILDTGYEFYRLHDDSSAHTGSAIDAQLSQFSLGFALGSDF